MKTGTIETVEYVKEWGKGLNKVHYHNVTFEGDEQKWNIGTKEQEPTFLKPGKTLNYEITDEEKHKIKRANTNQMQNKTLVKDGAKKSPPAKSAPKPESTSLIRKLDDFKESDLIFIDIETARVVDKLKAKSPLMEAWLYKTRYNNEIDRKTGKEFTPEEYYHEKAALYAPFAKVVTIVIGKITEEGQLSTKSYSGDEAEMLTAFNTTMNKFIDKNSSTAFAGWANIGFDQPFLQKRMLVHGIKPNVLLDTVHLKPWEINALDLKEIWKGTSFYPDSLISVAVALGLPSPKSKLDGAGVGDAYYNGQIDDIIEYCTGDVLTTANVYRKFVGKDLITLK